MNTNYLKACSDLLKNINTKKPLVLHLTNFVTINDCANMTLAIGASPIMSFEVSEAEELLSMSSALVLNIGTSTKESINNMLLVGKIANKLNVPIVLDPVGAGATTFRTNSIQKLLDELYISVIKGNLGEIKAISGLETKMKGVDSIDNDNNKETIAKNLANKYKNVIVISGKEDVVSDGRNTMIIKNGHPMLSNVTGTGCMTASLIGAFCGVTDDYLLAATSGILSMSLAGEYAFKSLKENDGIGTFKVKIFDGISNMNENILRGGNIELYK